MKILLLLLVDLHVILWSIVDDWRSVDARSLLLICIRSHAGEQADERGIGRFDHVQQDETWRRDEREKGLEACRKVSGTTNAECREEPTYVWLLYTNVYGRFGQSVDWKFKISLPPLCGSRPISVSLIERFSLKENQDSVLTSNAQNQRISAKLFTPDLAACEHFPN
jgi:hypothetical protein